MTVSDAAAVATESELAALAGALAGDPARWSDAERLLTPLPAAAPLAPSLVRACRLAIVAGQDPLGEAFCRLRPPALRRRTGATFTPPPIVAAMAAWAEDEARRSGAPPDCVVDPGAGSGRFLAALADVFPHAALVAVETDALAALILRATAAVRGFDGRLAVHLTDYRALSLPPEDGPTLFIGNPPYVRHHGIAPEGKDWLAETAARHGVKASRLAGLHIHFFLQTLALGRDGDLGVFITAAEWLDVNYGAVLRTLLADRLGGTLLQGLDPALAPFPDAVTTAAITGFRIGRRPESLLVGCSASAQDLGRLDSGRKVPWSEVARTARWSHLLRPDRPAAPPADRLELGDLFRVHRGQVTGANRVWIAGPHAAGLPSRLLIPAITKARELLTAGPVLADASVLRRVIDLPADLSALPRAERDAVDRFLAWAAAQGAATGYIAKHRAAWWAVSLYPPAPIVCTYMARRPPAFVLNRCGARLLNIAHGLYPRTPLPEPMLLRLVNWLRANVSLSDGRVYAGGLTKFEPKEIERLPIPDPAHLPA